MRKIIVLVLVSMLAVSGCGLFKQDPQKAVNGGLTKFADVKKMSSSLTMSGTMQAPAGEKPSSVQFSLQANGKTDFTDSKSPKLDVIFKLNASMDDQKMGGDATLKSSDKKIFVNVSNIEMPGEQGKAMKEQLGSFLNVWWSLPVGEDSSIAKLTDESKQISDLFKTTTFFKGAVEEGTEDVQGVKSTKYRVEVDKEALKKFLLDFGRVSGNQISPEEELAIGDSLNDVEFSGAVWIGKDGEMHRIKGTITARPKQGPSSSFEVDYMGWDYGKDVVVAAPEKSEEFNPLMLFSIFGAMGSLGQTDGVTGAAIPTPKVTPKVVVPTPGAKK